MTKLSTLHLNEAGFVSQEWADDIQADSVESSTRRLQKKQKEKTAGKQFGLEWMPESNRVSMPPSTFYTTGGKRLMDIIVAGLVTILILSWLIPVIGALIMLESRGPFFFIQARSGRRGKPFPCLKFRTMRHAPHALAFQQTLPEDARVTRLGKFLRKTNLDELPQFLNVLQGDMSLVGPRPHALAHDAMHWHEPAYRERYWVKPGITGLAQIRGSRGATGTKQLMEHRVRYDHFYIPRQSLPLDLKICVSTVVSMVKGDKNAY